MSTFDNKLREMAHRDRVPLPDGYDEMLQDLYRSLAPEEPAGPPRKERMMKRRIFPRLIAVAAIVALMAASMAVGALAFSTETVVEVPVEQETLTLEELGLTLILPDSWKGQYTLEKTTPRQYNLFINPIREKTEASWGVPGGMLFCILEIDEVLTAEDIQNSQWSFAANRYLFATQDCTYVLYYASDVQWDPSDPEQEALYQKMAYEIKEIRIVVDNVLS